MNATQKESAAKYLYDVSKGFWLAAIAGLVTGKITFVVVIILAIGASFSYKWAQNFEA